MVGGLNPGSALNYEVEFAAERGQGSWEAFNERKGKNSLRVLMLQSEVNMKLLIAANCSIGKFYLLLAHAGFSTNMPQGKGLR
jgi:hypothetical protein